MPKITFINPDGKSLQVQANVGETVLDLAHSHGINLEGACEGSMACSTCHVIVEESFYGRLPPPSEDQEDMLDLAAGLTVTSRLGCQIILTDAHDGLILWVPRSSRNVLLG